ncbi:hypothetical protein [Acidovorax sp. A1169]|uniref:hypothetical protein n=1 Tax=Acidovorax sp. A1169 TaxID=3059524 RepID=UPI002737EFBF|nr:hypothetical protein [Acidovorax sp. A1169]
MQNSSTSAHTSYGTQAQEYLDQNAGQAERAALVYDGFITLPSGRTDALIVLVRSFARPPTTLTMAVPYRNAQSPSGFAVHRPKFLGWQGPGTADYQLLGDAIFGGSNRTRRRRRYGRSTTMIRSEAARCRALDATPGGAGAVG